MIKRTSARFAPKSFAFDEEGDVNPMETVANLSDVMLVFAVALMLGIITHWGVNISSNLTSFDESDMEAIDEAQAEDAIQNTSSSGYEELGKAYKDPKTGEVYVIQNEDEQD